MELGYNNNSAEWYIIFKNSGYNHWLLQRFLHKEIKHVYAVQRADEYTWVVVNHTPGYVSVKLLSAVDYPHIRLIAGPENKIVRVTAKLSNRVRAGFCLSSCVETTKSLLGIKKFWVMTPYQLYRYLS